MTHPSSFHLLCGHHNHMSVLLIHHLPEVVHCILKAPLGGDEDFAFIHVTPFFMHALCWSVFMNIYI